VGPTHWGVQRNFLPMQGIEIRPSGSSSSLYRLSYTGLTNWHELQSLCTIEHGTMIVNHKFGGILQVGVVMYLYTLFQNMCGLTEDKHETHGNTTATSTGKPIVPVRAMRTLLGSLDCVNWIELDHEGFKNYAVEMCSGAMICKLSFIRLLKAFKSCFRGGDIYTDSKVIS
jgi:hypothetical protein